MIERIGPQNATAMGVAGAALAIGLINILKQKGLLTDPEIEMIRSDALAELDASDASHVVQARELIAKGKL